MTRLATQRGMTLIEMIVSLTVGSIIILAAFALLDASVAQTGKVTDRVDSTQRGRLALDEMVRQLRSQVCLTSDVPSVAAGTGSSVTFYTFMRAGEFRPELHTIDWAPASRSIVERAYEPAGAAGALTYPTAPSRTRTLLTDVDQDDTAPFLDYYTWSSTGQVVPSLRLAVPLAQSDLPRVVRIVIRFRVQPSKRQGSREATSFQAEVYSRTADANASAGPKQPACV